MNNQRYPLSLRIYKGENRILIIPMISHIGGYSICSEWFINIDKVEEPMHIGKAVLASFEFIKNSPVSKLTPKELCINEAWKKNSKYKSWKAFWNNNYLTSAGLYEDGHLEIYSLKNSETTIGRYDESIKNISLLSDVSVEEIGNAVIEVIKASEVYHQGQKVSINKKNIKLLNNSKITIIPPKDFHFIDTDDSGAAEIYQCYSYSTNENAEPSAEIFLGIASELDCNLNQESVHALWGNYYGQAEFFEIKEVNYGIFKYRIEMRNKDIHKISYVLQQEADLLLECSMEVNNPNRRKKLDEKLETMFEEFAMSCIFS